MESFNDLMTTEKKEKEDKQTGSVRSAFLASQLVWVLDTLGSVPRLTLGVKSDSKDGVKIYDYKTNEDLTQMALNNIENRFIINKNRKTSEIQGDKSRQKAFRNFCEIGNLGDFSKKSPYLKDYNINSVLVMWDNKKLTTSELQVFETVEKLQDGRVCSIHCPVRGAYLYGNAKFMKVDVTLGSSVKFRVLCDEYDVLFFSGKALDVVVNNANRVLLRSFYNQIEREGKRGEREARSARSGLAFSIKEEKHSHIGTPGLNRREKNQMNASRHLGPWLPYGREPYCKK